MKQAFKIPGAPVSKNGDRTKYIPGKGRGKGYIMHYTDAEVKEYCNKVIVYIKSQKPVKYNMAVAVRIFISVKSPVNMKGTRLSMIKKNMLDEDEMMIVMPTAKPDVDNLSKNLLDAVKRDCIVDDSYVCDESVRKRYGDEDYVVIEIEEIGIPCQWSVGKIKEYVGEL
jgi:Holliday junction resolvase RusA-like endonuclease